MKKFKKLIPAFCLLLVSAVLMGTSTFAWFSMNKTVTASGMQIKAKSNATYLLISNDATVATDKSKAETDNELAFTDDANAVYPAKFSTAGATFGSEPNQVTVPANGWYTANNAVASAATGNELNYKVVTEGAADYMTTFTMYLILSNDSEAWAKYVKVTATEATNKGAAIVLKVTNGTNTTYIDGGNGYIDCTTTNLTSTAVITVVAYVYIDGTNENVKSDTDVADLVGNFTLTFDLVESNA